MTGQIDPSIFLSVVSDLEHKIQAGHQREQRLIHERDRLLDDVARREQRAQKIWPVHVKCDGKCGAVIAFDPAPEEARLAAVLVALGWSSESGHVCPRCQR